MSGFPNIELRPFAVKNALLVDADPQIEALLADILQPGSWTIQRARDNVAALALAHCLRTKGLSVADSMLFAMAMQQSWIRAGTDRRLPKPARDTLNKQCA